MIIFKRKHLSIKWGIFAGILVFLAILLLLLFLLQTVYLDDIYKAAKKNTLNNANDKVEQVLEKQLGNLNVIEQQHFYKRAEKNGGGFTEEIAGDIQRDPFDLFKENEIYLDQKSPSEIAQESMVSVRILTISSTPYLTIVSACLTPVNATVQMIRQELIFVSIIMIILALVLAMVISRFISKPLSQMNESAKELAKGNYDVEFHDQSSLEISELGSTLNYTARQLKKTEQLQHELIANVSHDLRTPLTMIQAYAEMMRDIPGENTPQNVQVIIDEAGHLTGMVNDLLDISKLQAGVTQLNKTHFNLTANLEEAVQRIGRMASANEFMIELICDHDKEVFVDADEFKIYQVVYNLINNALNYSGDSRHVTVRQECIGDTVKVSVQDFGPGIAKENLPLVWERYYKVDKEHLRSFNGSGLGLAIVRKILELHNAQYGVDSTLGQGSTFWFCLKVSDE